MKDTSTSDDDTNLLVIIIDINPLVWSRSSFPLENALSHILVFINAHLSLKHDNKLAVIASHIGTSQFLYPVADPTPKSQRQKTTEEIPIPKAADVYPQFAAIDDAITNGLTSLMRNVDIPQGYTEFGVSMISGALSLALCYINRVLKTDDLNKIKPRILVISVSPDSPFQYIPIMNTIFSAQKSGIPIDVCKVFGEETVFLQQATHITGGVYLRMERPEGLLQYLMFTFLPDRYARNFLSLPDSEQVDFRAACFCHKNIVDIGHVCSVCLSIFCEWRAVCSTCKTRFPLRPMAGGARMGRTRSSPGSNSGTPRDPGTPTASQ